ncbi:flavin reductase family protein [Rhodobacteraceae bacterium NNCM2]|nr:flavin reductase family protein [Coraliihabitans acroporae]
MHSPSDTKALRDALGRFATGVTIVTAISEEGEPVGFTANSFTSVSLDPPLLLVCLAHKALSYRTFKVAESFAVNVLSADHEDIAMRFATPGVDKFSEIDWEAGRMGAPILPGCIAHFDCAMHQRVTAGDHDILMGRVIGFDHYEGSALVYHSGSFRFLP